MTSEAQVGPKEEPNPFPIVTKVIVDLGSETLERSISFNGGFTVILGPNGAGKTQLIRAIKRSIGRHCAGKTVRFLSAGRVGLFEQYRSDYDGLRGNTPRYDEATYGSRQDASRRLNYETLQGDFQTLALRPDIQIKIKERLRKLFSREIKLHWDGGALKVNFAQANAAYPPYSSAREASGLLHLVGLLTAIYNDEIGALLIDEPEVSLHPQLQAFLIREMLSVAGAPNDQSNKKIIVVATHSTEFLRIRRADDLPHVIFCHDLKCAPVQIPVDAHELRSAKIQALIARMGQEHKLAFFANSPLLVEGPSDSIICSALAGRLDIHIEAGGSQLLPVIGKGQFPVVAKLMRMVGKQPIVLADCDSLADGIDLALSFLNNSSADAICAQSGGGKATEVAREIYSKFCGAVEQNWEEIAPRAEKHLYWTHREQLDGNLDDAKKRSAFATLVAGDEEAIEGLGGIWPNLRKRLCFLLDLLESQCCFVLRRGPIECYFAATGATRGKPSEAALEAARIAQEEPVSLETRYADVLRCMRAAAKTQPIVEAAALRDVLLSIAAPALANFRSGASIDQIRMIASDISPEMSTLFDYSSTEDALIIELRTRILGVPGFPLRLEKHANPLSVIAQALGLT